MKKCSKNSVLNCLRDAYQEKKYISPADISGIAGHLDIPRAQVCSCASFYSLVNGLPEEEYLLPELAVAGPLLTYIRENKWSALEKVKYHPDTIIEKIKTSGLGGRGGGAFPVWKKWLDVKENEAAEKIIICNVSEGEPGTCKDQFLLLYCPEALIEGMAICAFATGSKKGYIYIRSGYESAAESVRNAIQRSQDRLGDLIINVVENLGSYVCGEETALIASLEGRRGEPANKPPYPTRCGFDFKPTVINNAETFATVPYILGIGAKAFRDRESRLYTVTGCGITASVCEMPVTASISDIYKAVGGTEKVKAFQLGGGASGGIFPAGLMDISLTSGEALTQGMRVGAGSIRFISENESLVEICKEVAIFFANESCGKCTPCHYGCKKISEMLQSGEYTPEKLMKIANYIFSTASCALGQSSCNALSSALTHFPAEFALSAEKETWI